MRLLTLFFLLSTGVCGYGQNTFFDRHQKELEAGVFLSTSGNNPFWLRTNQYGTVPLASQGVQLRARIAAPLLPPPKGVGASISNKKKAFTYDYAVEVVANLGQANQFLLPEAFASVKWKALELYVGRRKEVVGLIDTTLSSGSYIWSGNALPLPKIQLSIPDYTAIIGHGLIAIKGSYAHGWFDNGFVRNSYLHQKTLYGRLGKPSWKVRMYGGFNHQVQWGGKPAVPFIENDQLITRYPNDLRAYLNVVTGVSLNKGGEGEALTGVPLNEAFNRAGNHLGTVDVGAEIKMKNGKLLLYRQSVYDDGSLFYLSNIADGLFGISYKKEEASRGINHVVVEYLNTVNQGGDLGSGNTIPQLRGGDNYFNNGSYADGWTYRSQTIGTPFVVPLYQLNSKLTEGTNLNELPVNYLLNNRVKAFYVGIGSAWGNFNSLSKLSVTSNKGSFVFPLHITNFSVLQQLSLPYKKYVLNGTVAVDLGKLYSTRIGGFISVKRSW